MFQLQPKPTFVANVPLSVPGYPQPVEVPFTFRHKTRAQLSDWITRSAGVADVTFLAEVIETYTVQGPDGEPVTHTVGVLGTLLDNYPIAHTEIYEAYLRELGESKRKNS